MTDIKDIKNAMDNMPLGDGSAFAEISVGPAKHEQFLDAHYKKLMIVGVIVVAAVAGFIIYSGLNSSMEKKAGAMLVNASPVTNYTGSFKGLKEQGLQTVIQEYPRSQAAHTAVYLEALALWEEGKEDDGIAKMQSFIAQAPSPEWVAQASTVLACRLMNQGKSAEAKVLFENVVAQQSSIFAPFATLCLGDMAQASGNSNVALDEYKKVSDQFADSSFVVPSSRDEIIGGVLIRQKLFGIQAPEKVAPHVKPTPELQAPVINSPAPDFQNLKLEPTA